LNVISLVSQKGGCGKSTLATNLAVIASQRDRPALILDLDPQRSAEHWYLGRESDKPKLAIVESTQLPAAIDQARNAGYEWVFLDTPGRDEPAVAAAIRAASFCLIPCRPTPQDMRAVPPTAATISRLNKPFAFVLTQTPPRGQRVQEAKRGLSILGPVAPQAITSRTAYQDASGSGYAVNEFDAQGKAAAEMLLLFQWLQQHLKKRGNA